MAIGTRTDSNGNDLGMVNGTTVQIYGVGIPPKETIATAKLLVEVKAESYCRLRTMAKKILKFGLVESISMHLQVAPIYYINTEMRKTKKKH